MKKLLLISALILTLSMLFSATSQIYETNKGKVGDKLFESLNFRDNWTVILPMNLNNDGIDDLFFYDPILGQGEFYLYKNGKIDKITTISGFRKTWKIIQPIDYNGDGIDEVLFYDPLKGESELYKVTIEKKKLDIIKKWTVNSWRKNWKTFVPVQLDADAAQELFLYDPVKGEGEYLDFKADASLTSLLRKNDFRKKWNQIRAINLNNDGISDLFFYDAVAGVGEFYTIKENYELSLVKSNPTFRKNWRTILIGEFGSGAKNGDMFLYDPVTGEGEFYQIMKDGALKPLTETNTGMRKSWAIIMKGKFSDKPSNGLLFYESAKFKVNFKKIWGVNPY